MTDCEVKEGGYKTAGVPTSFWYFCGHREKDTTLSAMVAYKYLQDRGTAGDFLLRMVCVFTVSTCSRYS